MKFNKNNKINVANIKRDLYLGLYENIESVSEDRYGWAQFELGNKKWIEVSFSEKWSVEINIENLLNDSYRVNYIDDFNFLYNGRLDENKPEIQEMLYNSGYCEVLKDIVKIFADDIQAFYTRINCEIECEDDNGDIFYDYPTPCEIVADINDFIQEKLG